MKFTVLTLFPEMVEQAMHTSILGRAIDKHLIELRTVNIRDYTDEKHGRVDDYTYGGGAGMLMQAQPVYDAWKAATAYESRSRKRTVYVTPQGRPFTQSMAEQFAREEDLVFLCGHYEGIDARVLDTIVTDYVSIGDYVLTGGELPAMVMMDVIARLVPGVLHNDESAMTESFHRDLLEYPQYSRPEVWNGMPVPKVLLSGDHRRIEEWRLAESVKLTRERRPDLYFRYRQEERQISYLLDFKRENIHLIESLRCGRAVILYEQFDYLLLYDAGAGTYMITGWEEPLRNDPHWTGEEERCGVIDRLVTELGESVYGFGRFAGSEKPERSGLTVPDDVRIIISQSYWRQLLEERLGPLAAQEYIQACYTQHNPLPVRHRDIRVLDASALDFAAEHCRTENREYLAERITAGALYGIYADGGLVGFMGMHRAGSLGMLYIDEAHRRRGFAAALEAYCINRQLEAGMTSYLWVPVENEAVRALQTKLGLYLAEESLWELQKRGEQDEHP